MSVQSHSRTLYGVFLLAATACLTLESLSWGNIFSTSFPVRLFCATHHLANELGLFDKDLMVLFEIVIFCKIYFSYSGCSDTSAQTCSVASSVVARYVLLSD